MENLLNLKAAHSLVEQHNLHIYGEKIAQEIGHIKKDLTKGYGSDYAALLVPDDQENYQLVYKLAQEMKILKPTLLFLVGIGGSHLGSAALIQALLGTYHNEFAGRDGIKFYAADTLDHYQMQAQKNLLERALNQGEKVIITIITKSGTTTETLVNGSILIELLKKFHPQDYKKYVVLVTDIDSALWHLAHEYGYRYLPVPKKVGGRYSVFTSVGLFPLMMLGIDCNKLLEGARTMRDVCLSENGKNNPAALSASIIYAHYIHGKNIHDTFVYSPSLGMLGQWYRQLVGESLGKEHNKEGSKINIGITPTVSIGTNDLHSVAQLYLGGPYDKFTTFVYDLWQSDVTVPRNEFMKPLEYMIGKKVSHIKDTIIQGVALAYQESKRPFIEIIMPEINAFYMGQFMMLKMCEVIFLGALMDINPFDQPAVELYKSKTRELLR